MKKNMIIGCGVVAVAIATFLYVGSLDSGQPLENEAQSMEELVHDYSVGNISAPNASITSHQLIVTEEDDNESTYELPEDEFFVSIAPYIEDTHPCAIHSLTGCQGEMVEEEFHVYIEDEDGNEIVNETMQSLENGFIDLWLPRDKTYNTTITYDDKTVESEFSTFENDDTCIASMQLM